MSLTERKIPSEPALKLYEDMLLPRKIEERMLKLLRQGKISKWFSGIGQEAISVGVANALDESDYILPMHRNLGIFTTRGVDLYRLFCQLLGKKEGFTSGRDRSFHFGSMKHRIVGMISHLAATMPIADGLALASKLRDSGYVACSFCGEGATSEGDFHEALNLAGVWKLPVIFVIENNGYALSTPIEEQYACENLIDRAAGYGIAGKKIDGNNIFEVMDTVSKARINALNGTPTIIEANTFRMRGHEEASGTFYVPDKKFEKWSERDPIEQVKEWMRKKGYISGNEELNEIDNRMERIIHEPLNRALEAEEPDYNEDKELASIFSNPDFNYDKTRIPPNTTSSEKRFVDAIKFSLEQAFEEDDTFIILGQDIAEYGGVFKVTEGFVERFGKDRIRNTPIIESGAVGTAIGLGLAGYKPLVEMQFADFISCGFNQIVNNLAKSQYRWMPPVNITIRAPHGAGVGAGPFHSESPEGWFMQQPGLKIVVPSTVADAQNLLYSALYDPDPVLFFEHKRLYRSLREVTPDHCTIEQLGKAKVVHEGKDVTIITYGLGVHWALEMANHYSTRDVYIEVVDLRTLCPIDFETVRNSVSKTNRVLLLQEPSRTMGPMSEMAALLSENCFDLLDAPLLRCSSLDTPIPFNRNLEDGYLASSRLRQKMEELLNY